VTIKDVLTIAESRGVKLRVEGNDLVFRAPKGALTPELRQAIVDHKAELVAFLRSHEAIAPIPRADLDEAAPGPLSSGQARMWFFDRLAPEPPIYNLHCRVRIRGVVDHERLSASLSEVVARHAMLRASYPEIDGEPRCAVLPPAPVLLPVIDLRGEPDPEHALRRYVEATSTRPFDLAKGPLVRASLVALADDVHVLCIDLHHIATDAASMMVMSRDVFALYAGMTPPEPRIRYADYVRWQQGELASETARAVAVLERCL